MCNINAIFKTVGMDCTQELSDMSAYSKVHNQDGEGVLFSHNNKVIKSMDRIPFSTMHKTVKESEFIISHSRLATSGKSEKYLHPFVNQRFVLFHNGVFCRIYKHEPPQQTTHKFWAVPKFENVSDTSILFGKFVENFNNTQDIQSSLAKAIRYMKGGSYSIFLHDKQTGITYYTKCPFTSMHAGKTITGELIMSTDDRCMFFWPTLCKPIYPQAGIFYSIQKEQSGWELKAIGPLFPQKQVAFATNFMNAADVLIDESAKVVEMAIGR